MTDPPTSARVRPRAALKRAGALRAARELFLQEGYERTSVDAVAVRAGVSKRTVYDYFGDKEALFRTVVQVESEALLTSIEAAVTEELGDDVDVAVALLAFARRIATRSISSSHYAVLRRLAATEASRFPDLVGRSSGDGPERLLAGRLAAYARAGHLRAPDPHRAAEHFVALTFLLALDTVQPGPWATSDAERVDGILVDGVDAFLRAYATG